MKDIFLAVLSTTWNRKESKLFLLFSLIPILYLASTFMETSFMNVTSIETGAKLSFLEMYDGIFNLSFNSTLPTLSLFLLILSVVRSDIELHRLFLYKDIERKKILLSKILSILSLFALFVVTVLPYTPLAGPLKLAPLNGLYFLALILIIAGYMFLVTVVKKAYIKKYNEWL